MYANAKIKPIGFKPELYKDEQFDNSKIYNYLPVYKAPTNIPIQPAKPNPPTQVKYDPKYENLQMRSLWANQTKADTTSRIGTLKPLEYNDDSKGFTIGEAVRTFPQEIKDQYNIDMIGKQAGIKRNGGWLEKYEDGGTVPLQNITNFTPIKKQLAGWLDKY
jgi:hypothetical protein